MTELNKVRQRHELPRLVRLRMWIHDFTHPLIHDMVEWGDWDDSSQKIVWVGRHCRICGRP